MKYNELVETKKALVELRSALVNEKEVIIWNYDHIELSDIDHAIKSINSLINKRGEKR